jgi:hypothetical protein
MGSWGCPHDVNGVCQRVKKLPCDPGMRGCVLYGRVVFSNPAKNRPAKRTARTTSNGSREQSLTPISIERAEPSD